MKLKQITQFLEISFWAVTLSLALTFGLVNSAHADPDQDGPGFGHRFHGGGKGYGPDHRPPFLEGITLTDTQNAKIDEILKSQAAAAPKDNAASKWESHKQLAQLALSTDYTDDKAKALAETTEKQELENHVQRKLARTKVDHAIFQILTAEQQQQAKTNLANFKPRELGH